MNESFEIDVQLADGIGAVIQSANISIDVMLYLQRRLRYRFCAGKTDVRGRLHVTFDDLETWRLRNQAFSIMDYNTRLQECDSRISIVVPSLNELQQRQVAIEKWFPEDASKSENSTESKNGTLQCETVDVDVEGRVDQVFLVCKRCG